MTAVKTRSKAPYFDYNATVDVEVQIDPDELHDDGWHHESECNNATSPVTSDERAMLTDAVGSMHRQAHPNETLDPARCREEPCRSLYYEPPGGVR